MITLSKGLIRADIIAAKQAIDYFEKNKVRDIKNIAAYHLQQAVEKLIKIQIYNNCNQVNNAQMYTHQIEKLIIYADSLGINPIIPDYVRENSLIITAWEAGSRYDIGFSIRIDTLKKCYQNIVDWEKQIKYPYALLGPEGETEIPLCTSYFNYHHSNLIFVRWDPAFELSYIAEDVNSTNEGLQRLIKQFDDYEKQLAIEHKR